MKHKLRIKTNGSIGNVYLDDEDISSALRGYTIEHRAGCLPVVHLSLIADVEYDGDEVELEDEDIV